MKVKITFSIDTTHEIIDLEDYGYEADTKWDDLTEEEKNEVRDNASEQIIVETFGEHYEE